LLYRDKKLSLCVFRAPLHFITKQRGYLCAEITAKVRPLFFNKPNKAGSSFGV
jgi:hypothetical protein